MDGFNIRCSTGQRMDFELVASREGGSVELDWFGMSEEILGINLFRGSYKIYFANERILRRYRTK